MTGNARTKMDLGKPNYSFLNILIQRISSTRVVSGFFARNLHRIDGFYLKLSHGRRTLTQVLSGLPVVLLTTTGARSGLLRTMPLACIPDPDQPKRFAVVASNLGQTRHPAWYYNLKAHPRATGVIDGQVKPYVAHEANNEEFARFWKIAIDIYPGYQLYQKRLGKRRIPIMVLTEEER
jgi:deazaflavin-dependent oxidoreductase (nitroreductase family)